MSVAAMAWAWKQDVPPSSKLILLALADHTDDQGVCWPGLVGIAEKCRLTKRAIQYQIQTLEASGLLMRQSRLRPDGSQASNLYVLQISPPHETSFIPPMKPASSLEPSWEPSEKKKHPLPPRGEDGFEEFWDAYPRKQAKVNACKSWRKLKPPPELRRTIHAALDCAKDSASWLKDHGQYIPLAATWLNGRRWEDELSSPDDDLHLFPTDDGSEA